MTVFELVEGDDTQDQEFHKIDARLFKRCVDVLISRGKAQIISYSGNVGTAKENSISGLSGETGIKFF
ncbi:hypothetical protein H4219_003936 [Mycoemilia scoparia]|uniref:Uncharacterized protein n=1 Tax=Mycoemilia scoparia TaxID=417184 RepID=A0A9W8A2R6_9FUNG|nr:hypothetical protein H4219_003936 [Mycoemilia scoparia]